MKFLKKVLADVVPLHQKVKHSANTKEIAYTEYEDAPGELLSFDGKARGFLLNGKRLPKIDALKWVQKNRHNFEGDYDDILKNVQGLG